MFKIFSLACALAIIGNAASYSFVHRTCSQQKTFAYHKNLAPPAAVRRRSPQSASLVMIDLPDTQVLYGVAIGAAGLGAGVGLLAFTEYMGERGGGLSEDMATNLSAGAMMDDVETSSITDVGSLTDQLARALEEAGAINSKDDVQLSDEEIKKKEEELETGW